METNNFRTATIWCAIIITFFAFSSCTKNPVEPPPPQPGNQELVVQFSNTGVTLSTIDSVVAIIRDQDNNIKLWKAFDKASTAFTLRLHQLATGNYKAEVLAYSKKKADQTARQYALAKDIQLPLQQSLVVKAPTGNFTDTWFRRAIFFDGPEAVTIIAAMFRVVDFAATNTFTSIEERSRYIRVKLGCLNLAS